VINMSNMTGDVQWFAVRCFFELAPFYGARGGATPEHLYEERVTLWRAASIDAAIELAEQEAQTYCADETTWYLGLAQAFALFDPPESGAEVFSLMRESALPPEEYLTRHFDTGTERQQSSDDADPPADS
jgi:hypothetical protein